MMAYLQSLSQYNAWANNEVSMWLCNISEEQWTMQQVSSFDSIASTVAHIVAAEYIWIQRLQRIAEPKWIGSDDLGSKEDYLARWQSSSMELINYCQGLTTQNLDDIISFKRLNGEAYAMPIEPILIHVFNHSTYHRGQLVTMLRVAGYRDISSIDYSTYYLKHR